jgi:Zn-dependent peptidase ImmA (M78 family)
VLPIRGIIKQLITKEVDVLMKQVNKRNRHDIENFAQQTLKAHGLNSIPVDPVVLANSIGIIVNHATFSDENISGVVAKRGDEALILVNRNDKPFRKRFTIAHEVGHYLLHFAENDGELVDHELDLYRDTENDSPDWVKEVEANQFAAALLMPAEKVKDKWKLCKSVEEMARIFNVSEEAMGYRLATLRLQ